MLGRRRCGDVRAEIPGARTVIFQTAFALAACVACLLAGAPESLGGPVVGFLGALLMGAALAEVKTRLALVALATQFWASLAAFAIVAGLLALQSGLLIAPSAAENPFGARAATLELAGLGLGVLAMGAGARVYGWRRVATIALAVFLVFGLAAGTLFVMAGGARPLAGLPDRETSGALFGLCAILAALCACDELTRRGRVTDRTPLSTLPRRMIIPLGALATTGALVGFAGSIPAVIATLAGLAAMLAVMALRDRTGGKALFAALAAVFGLIAAVLAGMLGLPQSPASPAFSELTPFGRGLSASVEQGFGLAALWLADAGTITTGLALAAFGLFGLELFRAQDRRRNPTRGLGLMIGGVCVLFIVGLSRSPAEAPAVTALAALFIGLAAALTDRAGRKLAMGADRQRPAYTPMDLNEDE